VFQAGEGAGRSGSFFFFSHDSRFIIKTISSEELKLFLKILPSYHQHIKNNPKSLIAKIYGVFTVKPQSTNEVHIMLMENSCRFSKEFCMTKGMFDLKGSWVDRESSADTFVKKDLNFIKDYKKLDLL